MIYKWNEINYRTFKDIFKDFREQVEYLKDKVIEIQEPLSVLSGNHNSRVYLTNNPSVLDLIEDTEDKDQPFLKAFKTVSSIEKIQPKELLKKMNAITAVAYDGKRVPTLMPMFVGDEHCKAFLSIFFGDIPETTSLMRAIGENNNGRTGYWYLKDKSSNRFIDLTDGAAEKWLNSNVKTVRMRTFDFIDWWRMVKGYKSGHDELNKDGDLVANDFYVLEEDND